MKQKEDKRFWSLPLFEIQYKDKTYTQMYTIIICERGSGKSEAKRRKTEKREEKR